MPYTGPRENKPFVLLEIFPSKTLSDIIDLADDYQYEWNKTILIDQSAGILQTPRDFPYPKHDVFHTVESDIEQTQCSLLRYSKSLIMALVRAGMVSVGLDVHSGKYCGRYKVIGVGKFKYKNVQLEIRKVKSF